MVRSPHDLPRIAVIVDVPPPGERLEADAQPALCGALAEFVEIRGRPVDSGERIWGDVAADHQEITTQLLHDVELAFGPCESLGSLWLGHTFEIPEGLESDCAEPEILDHAACLGGRAVERQ